MSFMFMGVESFSARVEIFPEKNPTDVILAAEKRRQLFVLSLLLCGFLCATILFFSENGSRKFRQFILTMQVAFI